MPEGIQEVSEESHVNLQTLTAQAILVGGVMFVVGWFLGIITALLAEHIREGRRKTVMARHTYVEADGDRVVLDPSEEHIVVTRQKKNARGRWATIESTCMLMSTWREIIAHWAEVT